MPAIGLTVNFVGATTTDFDKVIIAEEAEIINHTLRDCRLKDDG